MRFQMISLREQYQMPPEMPPELVAMPTVVLTRHQSASNRTVRRPSRVNSTRTSSFGRT